MKTLEQANLELQTRIKKLEDINSYLKEEVSKFKKTNGNLLIEINNMRNQVKILKGKKVKVNNNPNSSKNLEGLKNVRKKKVYGILKNPVKYRISEQEVKFLKDIQYTQQLSEKQLGWYNSIVKRGLINKR